MGGQAAVRGHRAAVVDSHLAFLRFVNLKGAKEPRDEDHYVLDLGLGECLPSQAQSAQ